MIRVLHFSDVHVHVWALHIPFRDWFGKRLLGGANLLFRRRRFFADAVTKLEGLARFAQRERVDVTVCTGDYTALGTLPELKVARQAIEPLARDPHSYVTVPGNHDVYLPDALADGRFERIFGDLLGTDWPEYTVDGHWPGVRLYEDHLAVVTVNSARPNKNLLLSSGRIPEAQLQALSRLLKDKRLSGRTILVATHYAPRRSDGTPDLWRHGLENADALLEVCSQSPRIAILHGHIHGRFHLHPSGAPHIFGAGSATQARHEGVWLFEFDGESARALPVRFRAGEYHLEASDPIDFSAPQFSAVS
jgi:3',5'-cyclic AMP phosphodiesterase CpdA